MTSLRHRVPSLLRWALSAVVALVSGCGVGQRSEPLTTETFAHGPFEIVATGKRISSGAFPNNSGNPFTTMEVTAFGVRFGGKEVSVPGVGSRFWRVLRVMDAPEPSLIVSTTDFHLLTATGNDLSVRSFGTPSTNMAEMQWLDAAGGQPGPVRAYGIEKVGADDGTVLQGGRWLRLSYHTVLDIKTLTAYPVRPWVSDNPNRPAELNAGGIQARAFSPGQTQFVAPATGRDDDGAGAPYDALVVVDIPTGNAYAVPIHRRTSRYADHQDIDAAWIAHYFEWRRESDGHEKLVPRKAVKQLPWKGRFVNFGDRIEYRVPQSRPELGEALRNHLMERMGAKVAPDWIDPRKTSGDTFTLPGCDHVIALSVQGDHVGLFSPQPKTPPWVRCQDSLRKIGESVDAELATGKWDDLFAVD
ncbi:MAG: hypothetical protein IPK20_20925 [Betaproteobacteria bacterium]|nr:hypothetical protein [Betaproteobacteria bacterium]